VRPTDLTRCVLGAGLLAVPDIATTLTHVAPTPGVRVTVRVLAARYLVQSFLGGRLAPRWHTDLDVAVDAIHAATMAGLAAVSPEHRRLAAVSAAVATVLAVADARVGERR
jgi:hypothetical protein